MAEQLEALDAFAENPGSVPRTHITAYNSGSRRSDALFWPMWALQAPGALNIHTGKHSYT